MCMMLETSVSACLSPVCRQVLQMLMTNIVLYMVVTQQKMHRNSAYVHGHMTQECENNKPQSSTRVLTWKQAPKSQVQIGLERSRLLELEEKANGLQGKIGTQRKAMGGVNAAREANIQVPFQTPTNTPNMHTPQCLIGPCTL